MELVSQQHIKHLVCITHLVCNLIFFYICYIQELYASDPCLSKRMLGLFEQFMMNRQPDGNNNSVGTMKLLHICDKHFVRANTVAKYMDEREYMQATASASTLSFAASLYIVAPLVLRNFIQH